MAVARIGDDVFEVLSLRGLLFAYRGRYDEAEELTGVSEAAATAAVQDRHPGLRVEQIGQASAEKAFEQALGDDFK